MAMFVSVLWFGTSMVALVFAQRWMHSTLQKAMLLIFRRTKVAFSFYTILLLPGVVLHESSHWLAARLLGVRTRSFTLMPELRPDGSIRFGSVETDRADPVRSALIGAAPMLMGSLVLGILVFRILGLESLLQGFAPYDPEMIALEWERLVATPNLVIWIYLAMAVSNTMIPSAADRSAWVPVGLMIGVVAVIVALLGLGPQAAVLISAPLDMVLKALAGLLTLTVALDLLFTVPLWIVHRLLQWIIRPFT
jgi:hypothetical protein